MHDLDKDFPVADTVTFEPIHSFDPIKIMNIPVDVYSFMIKDSVIFVLERSEENFGHCYKMGSGEVLSTLLGRGGAENEMIFMPF